MVSSALDSGGSSPGLSPGRGHRVVFLGETLYFHNGCLRSMKMGTANLMQG